LGSLIGGTRSSMTFAALVPFGQGHSLRCSSYRAPVAASKRDAIPTHVQQGCAPCRIALRTATHELARVAEILHPVTITLGGSLASRSVHDAAAPGRTPITCLSGGGHREGAARGQARL